MNINELNDYPDQLHDIISDNVKRIRMEKKVSQLDLAQDMGLVGNGYITKSENRKNNHHFSIEHIVKISKILDVPIEEFFKGV
jgi:transcriptional regulator with XRE-family HTH domain